MYATRPECVQTIIKPVRCARHLRVGKRSTSPPGERVQHVGNDSIPIESSSLGLLLLLDIGQRRAQILNGIKDEYGQDEVAAAEEDGLLFIVTEDSFLETPLSTKYRP